MFLQLCLPPISPSPASRLTGAPPPPLKASPTSPVPLPGQGHPSRAGASTTPRLWHIEAPRTLPMPPPHAAQPLLPENTRKKFRGEGPAPPQGWVFIPRAQNGEGAGPRFVSGDERRGASPAPSPTRGGSGAARGPPGSPGRISAGLEAPGTSTPPTRSHGRGQSPQSSFGVLTAPPSQPPPTQLRTEEFAFVSRAAAIQPPQGRGHLPPLPLLEPPRTPEEQNGTPSLL